MNQSKVLLTLLLLLLVSFIYSPEVEAHPHECYSIEYADHYLVKPGDTYFKIAKKFYGDGYLWQMIYQANLHYRPRYIPVGAVLHIPSIQMEHTDCHSPQVEEPPVPPVKITPERPSTPIPIVTPMPVATPTPQPTATPVITPSPTPISPPPSVTTLKQEAFTSQLNVFYQPSFYSEHLQSRNVQTSGQVASGVGAKLQILPHENLMISGQYQRRFNVLERQGTKEQTERLHQQANLGVSYVAPIALAEFPPKDKSLSIKAGVNAHYNHYQGKTQENELSPLRERDYMDGQFQTVGAELEVGMAYQYKGYSEPITLEANIGYSPYQAVIQDPTQNLDLPQQMQGVSLGLSVKSKIPDTDANIGLHYQFDYNFGDQFQQSQHQINVLTGYEF